MRLAFRNDDVMVSFLCANSYLAKGSGLLGAGTIAYKISQVSGYAFCKIGALFARAKGNTGLQNSWNTRANLYKKSALNDIYAQVLLSGMLIGLSLSTKYYDEGNLECKKSIAKVAQDLFFDYYPVGVLVAIPFLKEVTRNFAKKVAQKYFNSKPPQSDSHIPSKTDQSKVSVGYVRRARFMNQ